MAECPHPPELAEPFRDWNPNIGTFEVGAECGVCGDVLGAEQEDGGDLEALAEEATW